MGEMRLLYAPRLSIDRPSKIFSIRVRLFVLSSWFWEQKSKPCRVFPLHRRLVGYGHFVVSELIVRVFFFFVPFFT